jgi:hypothetical protein
LQCTGCCCVHTTVVQVYPGTTLCVCYMCTVEKCTNLRSYPVHVISNHTVYVCIRVHVHVYNLYIQYNNNKEQRKFKLFLPEL